MWHSILSIFNGANWKTKQRKKIKLEILERCERLRDFFISETHNLGNLLR